MSAQITTLNAETTSFIRTLKLRSLFVTVQSSIQRSLSQRGALFLAGFLYIIVVGVLAGLWRAAATFKGGAILGYSAVQLTWYIAGSEAVTIAMNSRLIADIGDDIVSGSIAVELLRPVSVLRQRVATEVGRVIPRLGMCIMLGITLSLIAVGRPPKWIAVLVAIPSMLLAVCCNIVAQHAFACLAFWVRETGATWFLYQKFVFMLGGMLLPLQFLPKVLRTIAQFTPFPSMAYAPARIFSGHIELHLILWQCVWLVALCALAILAFRKGEKHLQVVGG
jgi:ABC-2 type transport system permease protein